MAIWHLVASTARGDVALTEWGLAGRLWDGLRKAFPRALAVGLMPDHAHVIDEGLDEGEARLAMARRYWPVRQVSRNEACGESCGPRRRSRA